MGAISPEIVQLLKVKLPLENDQKLFSCFIDFQNFPEDDPPYPP